EQATRPRTVTTTNTKPEPQSTQRTTPTRAAQPNDKKAANHFQQDEARVVKDESNRRLTPSRLRLKISEAQRLLQARPVPTAMTASLEFVAIAALLPETSQIHLIRLNKQTFLTKGAEVSGVSTLGLPVQLRIVGANGVNTAVPIFDDKNRA